MNYETKRDVFGQLLNAYQNLIMKDIEIPDENYRENITTPWNIIYDAALPDDMPVIPKAVEEYIKRQTDNLPDLKVESWIIDHGDTFTRAWLLGVWCVEETGEIVKQQEDE